MQSDSMPIGGKLSFKLEKYGDEWTQADIDSGRAIPYEVLHTDLSELSEAEIKALGLNCLGGE